MTESKSPSGSTPPETPTIAERLRIGARQLLEREGASALTARRIAAESGRTTMCIYSKFGGVGALVAAVHDDAAESLLGELSADAATPERYTEWARANPGAYRLLFEHDPATLGIDEATRRSLIDTVAGRFADGEAGYRIWAMTHGLVTLEAASGGAPVPGRSRSWGEFVRHTIGNFC